MIYTRNTCIILVKEEVFFLSIGDNIKRIREAKGISQYKLAQMLNISQQSVDQWERSLTNPRKSNIDKISSVLNVSVNELFGNVDTNNAANKLLLKDKIKTLREAKNLTQSQLGKLINKSSQVISNWERGYTSSINQDDIKNLANALSVNVSDLLEDVNNLDTTDDKEKKKPKDLIKLLEKEEFTLNGAIVTQEDKEKLKKIIEIAFWDAKEKNKRKK